MTKKEFILKELKESGELNYRQIFERLNKSGYDTTESVLSKTLTSFVHMGWIYKPAKDTYMNIEFSGINPLVHVLSMTNKLNKLDDILTVVCEVFNVDKEAVKGKKRDRELVDARKCYVYMAKIKLSRSTLIEIGRIINKDHSAVIYLNTQAKDLIKYDKSFSECVGMVDIRLNNNFSTSKFTDSNKIGYYWADKNKHELSKHYDLK